MDSIRLAVGIGMFSTSMELAVTAADRVDLERVIRASINSELEKSSRHHRGLHHLARARGRTLH